MGIVRAHSKPNHLRQIIVCRRASSHLCCRPMNCYRNFHRAVEVAIPHDKTLLTTHWGPPCMLVLHRARDWVAETLEWLATEVLTAQDSSHAGGVSFTSARMGAMPGAAAGADEQSVSTFLGAEAQTSPEHKERLRRDFVDLVSHQQQQQQFEKGRLVACLLSCGAASASACMHCWHTLGFCLN